MAWTWDSESGQRMHGLGHYSNKELQSSARTELAAGGRNLPAFPLENHRDFSGPVVKTYSEHRDVVYPWLEIQDPNHVSLRKPKTIKWKHIINKSNKT